MYWGLSVLLDGVEIFDRLVGELTIEAEETASGLCSLQMIPAAGSIDPNAYENIPLVVTYQTKDAAGAVLSSNVRGTFTTTTASYDPDSGVLSIDASNDLQARLEGLDRAGIDALISSGSWSPYVFDDGADGWQYAQDRLSTTPAEVHVTPGGALEVTNWAVKVTPDVTLTDAARFSNTLKIQRNTRRELISRNVINFDFRFVRLRHREIAVSFTYTGGICAYLDGLSLVPQRAMIQSAADSTPWTRISDITFEDLPSTGTYCGGKNFTENMKTPNFCLDASWTAARRWAQTITEQYQITVNAPDIETAVGLSAVSENYQLEAIYNAADYERSLEFDSAPAGATLSVNTDDYQLDADTVVERGRTELEAAQLVAINKARTEILGRARGNRVSVGAVYDPSITLASTVRINTPSLICKGKVFAYVERFDLATGRPGMTLELAISRHGGSGAAVDDPIVAPTQPAQTAETPTPRTYSLGVRSGGKIGDPPFDPSWDGFITNAYGNPRTDPSNLYPARFNVLMPEIEATARDEATVQASSAFEVSVPQDELTLQY